MWQTMIIDDEDINIIILEKMLSRYPLFSNIIKSNNPQKAFDIIMSSKPDIVFLDIDMPDINGIELAKKIMDYNPKTIIIFITSFENYAINAFELYALDYIVKPVMHERLDKTVNRLISKLNPEYKEPLSIKTFGNFEVFKGDHYLKWHGSKVKELFCFLISHYGRSIHKELIIDTIWPDYPNNRALGNLHTAIHRLKHSFIEFENHIQIEYNCDHYKVILKDVAFDLSDFDQIVKATININEDNLFKVKEALNLYTGPFLEQNGYIWSYSFQAYYEIKYQQLLEKLIKFLIHNKKYDEASDLLKDISNSNSSSVIDDIIIKLEAFVNGT